jgi:hypothetical protein
MPFDQVLDDAAQVVVFRYDLFDIESEAEPV